MNPLQRLLSNTAFAFISNIIVKASNSVLFIFIGRLLGANEAGSFNLAITYFTIMFGLSAWGLQELLVRDLTTRKEESKRFLTNYLALRVILSVLTYILIVGALLVSVPYSPYTLSIIIILGIAVLPEAIFSILQAFFEAHENLFPPAAAATVNSIIKLVGGFTLLWQGGNALAIAWLIPIGSFVSLLVFIFPLLKTFQNLNYPANPKSFNLAFSWDVLRQTPTFFVIHIFSILDYQTDAFLISLFLTEEYIGWYGASQTTLLAFWTLPVAIRAAIFPVMTRFYNQQNEKLIEIYDEVNRFLIIGALPAAAGISILAQPIIFLIFGEGFEPATTPLQWSIWAIISGIIIVPSARLLIIDGRQKEAAWITGISMLINIIINVVLIPNLGINGAAIARTTSSLLFAVLIYLAAQRLVLKHSILHHFIRPIIATIIMALIVWQLRDMNLLVSIGSGIISYAILIILLGGIQADDKKYLDQLYNRG